MSETAEIQTFGLKLENHYARLPGEFYTAMPAECVGEKPVLLHANPKAAALIGLDPSAFADPSFVPVFSGHKKLGDFQPLAMAYSGHQFGQWAGQLGDGRALLIAQVRNPQGELWDVQLKGSGLTPYSRFGDGRAVMRSTIREYLGSEAVAALGIPVQPRAFNHRHRRDGEARGAGAWRDPHQAGALSHSLRPFRAFPSCRQA